MTPSAPDQSGAPGRPAVEPEFESLGEALHDIEEAMPNFAGWLYSCVRGELGHRVVDAGAGIGTYAELLLKDGREVVALEYDGAFARELQRRFAGRGVHVFQADLGDAAGLPQFEPADSMLCLNVLEHIKDDAQTLRNFRERVKPGGTLVILVPAYPRLFNTMDRALGHFRRYSKGQLEARLRETGWQVRRTFRFNAFGVPGWYVAGMLRRKNPGRTLSQLFDTLLPAFAQIEKYAVRGAWGLSLVSVCRRVD
jgi:SAM-dependent methyltransferase